eukprot:766203-Hanusia_phi.AAC.11
MAHEHIRTLPAMYSLAVGNDVLYSYTTALSPRDFALACRFCEAISEFRSYRKISDWFQQRAMRRKIINFLCSKYNLSDESRMLLERHLLQAIIHGLEKRWYLVELKVRVRFFDYLNRKTIREQKRMETEAKCDILAFVNRCGCFSNEETWTDTLHELLMHFAKKCSTSPQMLKMLAFLLMLAPSHILIDALGRGECGVKLFNFAIKSHSPWLLQFLILKAYPIVCNLLFSDATMQQPIFISLVLRTSFLQEKRCVVLGRVFQTKYIDHTKRKVVMFNDCTNGVLEIFLQSVSSMTKTNDILSSFGEDLISSNSGKHDGYLPFLHFVVYLEKYGSLKELVSFAREAAPNVLDTAGNNFLHSLILNNPVIKVKDVANLLNAVCSRSNMCPECRAKRNTRCLRTALLQRKNLHGNIPLACYMVTQSAVHVSTSYVCLSIKQQRIHPKLFDTKMIALLQPDNQINCKRRVSMKDFDDQLVRIGCFIQRIWRWQQLTNRLLHPTDFKMAAADCEIDTLLGH